MGIETIIPEYEADYWNPIRRRTGLHVCVFEDAAHGRFICYGRIARSEWNAFAGDYSYEIQVCHSEQIVTTFGWYIDAATPDAMRMGFKSVEGGFPELARKS